MRSLLLLLCCGLAGCTSQDAVPKAVQVQLRILGSKHPKDRWQAARELGKQGAKAAPAAQALAGALRDRHWLVRGYAARALVQIGPKAAPAFLEQLHKHHLSYKFGGESAFGIAVQGLRAQVVPALVKRAKEQPGKARSWALSALTLLGPDALPILLELSRHQDNDLRASTLRTLPQLGALARPAEARMLAGLADHAAYVRKQAAYALGALAATSKSGLSSKDAGLQLEALLLKDPEVRVRLRAAQTLALMPYTSTKAVGQLLKLIQAPLALNFFRYNAIGPLGVLAGRLPSSNPQARKQRREVVQLLQDTLSHRLSSLRLKAVEALGSMGLAAKHASLALLGLYLKERHLQPLIRRSLARIMTARQKRQLLANPSPVYRHLGLRLLGTKAGREALRERVERDKDLGIRQRAYRLLLSLPPAKAVSPKGPTKAAPAPASKPTTSRPASAPASKPAARAPVAPRPKPSNRGPLHWLRYGLRSAGLQKLAIKALGKRAKTDAAAWALLERSFLAAKAPATQAALAGAIELAGRPTGAKAIARLVALMASRHLDGRRAAVAAIGVAGSQAAATQKQKWINRLLQLIRDAKDPALWRGALSSFGQLVKKPDGPLRLFLPTALESLLKHSRKAVRERGLRAVALLPVALQRKLRQILLKILDKDRFLPCRIHAAERLAEATLSSDKGELWAWGLYDPLEAIRLASLKALSRLAKREARKAIPGLLDLVRARDPRTESRAIEQLARLGVKTHESVALLAQRAVYAKAWTTRLHAAHGLGLLKAKAARQALQRAARDPHPQVRKAAQAALRRL